MGGIYLAFLLPALMGLFAQIGGTTNPLIWRVSFVVVAAIGCWSTLRLLQRAPGDGDAGTFARHRWIAAVIYAAIAVLGVAPELAEPLGVTPLQAEATLLILLVAMAHALVWEFMTHEDPATKRSRDRPAYAILCRMVPSDDAILTHLRRGALEYCVLAMLRDQQLYGLDIARRLTVDGILMSGEGTLYPLLARLRKAGLVDTTWQESVEGPPRRYYSLTATAGPPSPPSPAPGSRSATPSTPHSKGARHELCRHPPARQCLSARPRDAAPRRRARRARRGPRRGARAPRGLAGPGASDDDVRRALAELGSPQSVADEAYAGRRRPLGAPPRPRPILARPHRGRPQRTRLTLLSCSRPAAVIVFGCQAPHIIEWFFLGASSRSRGCSLVVLTSMTEVWSSGEKFRSILLFPATIVTLALTTSLVGLAQVDVLGLMVSLSSSLVRRGRSSVWSEPRAA